MAKNLSGGKKIPICCSILKYEDYTYVRVSNEESTDKVYMGQSSKQSLNQTPNGSAIQTLEQTFFQKNVSVKQKIQNDGCLEQINTKCFNEDGWKNLPCNYTKKNSS